jgi:hypothetical protein
VNSDSPRQKRRALMADLIERKVRARARQLYDRGGQVEGHALRDWVQAESEVVENTILAPLYLRLREGRDSQELVSAPSAELSTTDSSAGDNYL